MRSNSITDYDLIVIGGGPSGSTAGALVAMQGHRVLLLERKRFPRHRIGESLLPATVHGVCRLLGVSEELENAGFMRKNGGTFLWGKSGKPWTFSFSRGPQSRSGFAYQVERSRFDTILLNNAARRGVHIQQEANVTDILFAADTVSGVSYHAADGKVVEARAPYVIDAGGFESPFHRLVGERHFSPFFQNIALYAYFENGKRLPPPNSGNIFSVAFPNGWFWYIPLSPTLTSVGVVVSRDAWNPREDREAAFNRYLMQCPHIREMLTDARRVTTGLYGEFRVRQDYSYCNSSFHRNGLVLIGDAACFIDPVFSSGVHLGTYSALLAARSVNTSLRGDLDPKVCFLEFEHRYRREYLKFYEFICGFYDMHRDERSYFWEARKVLGTPENAEDAFVRLVAGMSESADPSLPLSDFTTDPRTIGRWLQAAASAVSAPSEEGRPHVPLDLAKYVTDLTAEITQMHMQAFFGRERHREQPIQEGGLVPATDGLHWSPGAVAIA